MKRADIMTKKETLEVLERMFEVLDEIERDANTTWGLTGNLVPKRKWNSEKKKSEDVLDDDGNVVMEEEYGTVPKKKDEYDDRDKAKLEAVKAVKVALEKLI